MKNYTNDHDGRSNEYSMDDYNRGGLIAFVFSTVFCLLFFSYIAFIHPGVDLKEVTQEESTEMQLAGGGAAFDIKSIEKPWLEDENVIAHGKKVYATNCAVCHGAEGRGDGPAAAGLVPPARNLVKGGWKMGGDSISLYKTLQNGIAGGSMASFKHLSKSDRWALVQFVRSITEDKKQDDLAQLEAFAMSAD